MSDYTEHLISMAGGDGDVFESIQRRVDAASEGPWESSKGANADGATLATTGAHKAAFLALSLNDDTSPLWLVASPDVIPAATGDGPRAKANAEFIAHARTDVPYLLALVREQATRIKQVEALASRWATLGAGHAYYSKRVRHALKVKP